MMSVPEQLEKLADDNQSTPLVILGYEVDKTDLRQVYGALVWIETELLALLMQRKQ
jgi:hypothetical protein